MKNTCLAVVVTYNRIETLRECLIALYAQTLSCDICLVDNGSCDGTREFLDEEWQSWERQADELPYELELHHLKTNLGGAGGFSYGMKHAVEEGYSYIWIMDDDTIPKVDALEKLFDKARIAGEFGFLSSQVNWIDGSPCRMNRQHVVGAKRDGLVPVDIASFVSLLFRADAIRTLGLPYEEYFIWGDDKEYTLRLSAHFPSYLVEESVVIHKMKTNAGSSIYEDEMSRVPRYYYAYRNDLCTARLRGLREVIIYLLAFELNALRVLIKAPDGKIERLRVMYRGRHDGWRFHPSIHYVDGLDYAN